MAGRVLTIAQQKGGAGKTTLVAHLAVALAGKCQLGSTGMADAVFNPRAGDWGCHAVSGLCSDRRTTVDAVDVNRAHHGGGVGMDAV